MYVHFWQNGANEEHTVSRKMNGKYVNEYEIAIRRAEAIRKSYKPGQRIVLIQMGDDPCPIPDGTRGTVVGVDSIGTVHCDFDNGRSLGLVQNIDSFRKLTEKEIAEENAQEDNITEDNAPVME